MLFQKKTRSLTAAASIAALFSCHQGGPVPETAETAAALSAPGCDSTMWIGVRRHQSARCPKPPVLNSGYWFVHDPFEVDGSPDPVRPIEMCTFIYVPGTSATPTQQSLLQLSALVTGWNSPLTRIEQSCVKTAGMTEIIADEMAPRAREAFLEQADRVSPIPVGPLPADMVAIALVDSVPDSDELMETPYVAHAHGLAVGMLIRDLACPDGLPCPIRITTHLAFQRRDECTDCEASDLGGHAGRPAELAVAIHRAVDNWQRQFPEMRLVMNLSLGWFDRLDPNAPATQMPLDMLAVYNALNEASCYGALIFAAAGNTIDGPSPDAGPLYPAAWEMRPTLTDADCWSELGIVTPGSRRLDYGPLLYSVGGVDGVDQPSLNVRPFGRPLLAAPAENLAQKTVFSWGDEFRSVLSGSSVSTAVASAAAAVAWSYQEQEPSLEIAELLYESGEPLYGQTADYCYGRTSCDEIHRISMCGVLQQTCSTWRATCPDRYPISCSRRPAYSDDRVTVDPGLSLYFEANVQKVPPQPTATAYVAVCGGDVTAPIGSTDIPCPNDQYANSVADPANHPQPGAIPCRLCMLLRSTPPPELKLYVAINSDFPPGTTITNASIELSYPNGSHQNQNVELGTLSPGYEAQTTIRVEPSGFNKATISFLITAPGAAPYSSRDPLIFN